MNVLDVLVSLDRARSRAPATVVAGARRVGKSALENARRASQEIKTSVDERRVLAQALDTASEAGSLARLTDAECYELLVQRSVGRLAYIARAGVPDIVPVNYVLDGTAVLIRSAPGPKLQAAERSEQVAFHVDEIDEEDHSGWSVTITGRASRVTPESVGSSVANSLTPWASGPRRHLIRIVPRRIEGRRLL